MGSVCVMIACPVWLVVCQHWCQGLQGVAWSTGNTLGYCGRIRKSFMVQLFTVIVDKVVIKSWTLEGVSMS